MNTVFIRIVAVATINFSHAGMQLLLKGGSDSTFINVGVTPLGGVATVDSFFRTDLRIFELYDWEIRNNYAGKLAYNNVMHVIISTKLSHAIIISVCDYSLPSRLLASLLCLAIKVAWTTYRFNEPKDLHVVLKVYATITAYRYRIFSLLGALRL